MNSEMKRRFFAFGCSYTLYCYPSWADFIGVNFDEHYNYGRSGASNTFIMNKMIEADEKFNFNPETDLVMVMLTGIGRFSYMHNSQWITEGDLLSNFAYTKNPKVKKIIDTIWNEEWIVYQSWIASKVIKKLLTAKNIKHKILMSTDNQAYLNENANIEKTQITQVKEIYDLLDVKKPFAAWTTESTENRDTLFWKDTNKEDGHPSMRSHFKFVKDHFPELITDTSTDVLNQCDLTFDSSSLKNQLENYKLFRSKYDLGYSNPLFGKH